MATTVARRIDDFYRDDPRALVPALELMGGPAHLPSPVFVLDTKRGFAELAGRWREATRFSSALDEMVEHRAYRAIIRMGKKAVPLLLAELRTPDPDHWGPALQAITGCQPVPAAAAGKTVEIARAWLDWANAQGIQVE